MNEDKRTYFENKYRGRIGFAGPKHPRVKQVLALSGNTKPNPKKFVVIEGLWSHEVIRENKTKTEAFLMCPELIYTPEAEAMADFFVEHADSAYLISEKVFQRVAEKENSNGMVSVCYLPRWSLDDITPDETRPIVILDGIEIPGNIGTIIRTCDGADASGIIVCNQRARLTHPKLIRSSHGANFRIPVVEAGVEETLDWLDCNGYTILLTDTDAKSVYSKVRYKGRIAIIAGSERYGISKDWYRETAQKIKIPMLGKCDSLNVAVSTAIILYEVSLQLKGIDDEL
ncbi:MAG: RNA methyltransferase [Candidatus Cloacimonetes bacterium]|nr:RNA methyltransferase [Candidatus Cloacimonadota bacterium]